MSLDVQDVIRDGVPVSYCLLLLDDRNSKQKLSPVSKLNLTCPCSPSLSLVVARLRRLILTWFLSDMKHLLPFSYASMRLTLKRDTQVNIKMKFITTQATYVGLTFNNHNFNYSSIPSPTVQPCPPLVIDCGQPQANPGSSFSGHSFTVHSTVDYKCDPGFKEITGSTERICGLDAQWTGQPLTCKCKCAVKRNQFANLNQLLYLSLISLYYFISSSRT